MRQALKLTDTAHERGSKVGEGERRALENAIADLKEALKGDDADAITAKTYALNEARNREALIHATEKALREFTEVDDDKKNKKSA